MSSSYVARDWTPVLEKELRVMLAQCEQDANLKLAVGEFLAASITKAVIATDDEIEADVSGCDAASMHAALIGIIHGFRRLYRASSVLLLAIAEGHIAARKGLSNHASDKRHEDNRSNKEKAKGLWDNWQEYPYLYENKTAFDSEVSTKLQMKPRGVKRWREGWQHGNP